MARVRGCDGLKPDIVIRRLIPGDEAIAASLAWQQKGAEVSAGHFAGLLARPDCILIAALDGETPVGLLLAYELPRIDGPRPMVMLYEVGVDEGYRRRAIARRMICLLKSVARQRHARKIFVITDAANEPAMRLYGSTGGRRVTSDDVVFTYEEDALGES